MLQQFLFKFYSVVLLYIMAYLMVGRVITVNNTTRSF